MSSVAAAADVVFNSSLSPFSCAGAFVYFCTSACVCDCGGFFLILGSVLLSFQTTGENVTVTFQLYIHTVYRMSKSNFLKHRSGGLNSGH